MNTTVVSTSSTGVREVQSAVNAGRDGFRYAGRDGFRYAGRDGFRYAGRACRDQFRAKTSGRGV